MFYLIRTSQLTTLTTQTMIIWSGLGFLVVPIVIAWLVLSVILTGRFSSDPDYFQLHGWPMALGLVASAVCCWILGRFLRASGAQTLIDPRTGAPVILRRRHSLFFVPVQWWAPILLVMALGFWTVNKTPEELKQEKEERAAKMEERASARALQRTMKDRSSELKR